MVESIIVGVVPLLLAVQIRFITSLESKVERLQISVAKIETRIDGLPKRLTD